MAATVSVTLKMIDQMSKGMGDIANNSEKMLNNIISFGDKADAAYERATSGSEKLTDSMNSVSDASEKYADQSTKAQDALEQQATSAEKAAEEFGEVGEEAEDAGRKSEEFGDKASKSAIDLGEALAAAGIVAALKAIADAYFECDDAADAFEASMAKVNTIADTSAVDLATIESDIVKLSQETGQSVNDLSESVYSAISASVDTADAVQFVAQANALAVGGFTESATAVDVLTTAINAYGMTADDATAISDKLITTQNLGKTTVDELASSMGTVIPTAAAFGVSLDNLAAAYVTLTRNGINTANATTMLNGMFSELGDEGSAVAKILEEETGQSFSELMASGKDLGDVIEILGDSVDGDSTAFINLWGNIRAGRGAVNIFNAGAKEFGAVMDEMATSTGAADTAFQKMTQTGQFVEQKWTNALANLKIAIGNAVPQLDGLMEAGTEVINTMTEFINTNPEVVTAISAVVTVLATFTTGIMAASTGAKALDTVMSILGTSFTAFAANPVAMVITAVAALTAGLVLLDEAYGDDKVQVENLTVSSQALADQITEQEGVVQECIEKWGEFDDRTLDAKIKLEDLEAEFAATKMTVEDLTKIIDQNAESIAKHQEAYQNDIAAIRETEDAGRILVRRLETLESTSEKTMEQKREEQKIVERLNSIYPTLGLQYDEVTDKLNKSTEALKDYCKEKAEEERLNRKADELVNAYIDAADAIEARTMAQEEYNAALEKMHDLQDKIAHPENLDYFNGGDLDYLNMQLETAQSNWLNMKDALEQAESNYQTAADRVVALGGSLEELEGGLEGAANKAQEAAAVVQNATSAMAESDPAEQLREKMSGVFEDVQEDAEALIETYNKVHDAAVSAVESSIGLFEKVSLSAEDATKNATDYLEALKSQEEYLEKYNENIQKASEYNIDEGLIKKLADGSQEGASQLNDIITHIEKLGPATDEAIKYIDNLNEAFKSVEDAKETLADTMTALNDELKQGMENLKQKMDTGIKALQLDKESSEAARKTMEAFVTELTTYGDKAISEANRIASAINAAFNSIRTPSISGTLGYSPSVTQHANGTLYGENVYLAGEYGPELIVGRQGSEVFPASETAKILNAVMNLRDSSYNLAMAPGDGLGNIVQSSQSTTTNNENRNISLTIKGKGSHDIGQGVSMGDLRAYMQSELEGALMKILQHELYEEGSAAYEF
ncbi:MAG: phage tail tape measure protein [Lachnospiraceae bacterium]|nr:phage tail tape measure protein [Lachnospiraceae bacterium]